MWQPKATLIHNILCNQPFLSIFKFDTIQNACIRERISIAKKKILFHFPFSGFCYLSKYLSMCIMCAFGRCLKLECTQSTPSLTTLRRDVTPVDRHSLPPTFACIFSYHVTVAILLQFTTADIQFTIWNVGGWAHFGMTSCWRRSGKELREILVWFSDCILTRSLTKEGVGTIPYHITQHADN